MLWFALGVIAAAGITLVVFRLMTLHEPGQRRVRPPAPPTPRPYAPDDDEEFLRSLSRKPRE